MHKYRKLQSVQAVMITSVSQEHHWTLAAPTEWKILAKAEQCWHHSQLPQLCIPSSRSGCNEKNANEVDNNQVQRSKWPS